MKDGRAINAAAFTTAIHRWRCESELIFYIGMPSNYSSIHSNVSLSAAFHHQWWTHSHWLWSVRMIMETFASDEFIGRKTNHTLSCHHHDLYLYLTWRGALLSSLLLFLDMTTYVDTLQIPTSSYLPRITTIYDSILSLFMIQLMLHHAHKLISLIGIINAHFGPTYSTSLEQRTYPHLKTGIMSKLNQVFCI